MNDDKQGEPRMTMPVDGHIAIISLDKVTKKNAITPVLMMQLSERLTAFDDDLWVPLRRFRLTRTWCLPHRTSVRASSCSWSGAKHAFRGGKVGNKEAHSEVP